MSTYIEMREKSLKILTSQQYDYKYSAVSQFWSKSVLIAHINELLQKCTYIDIANFI